MAKAELTSKAMEFLQYAEFSLSMTNKPILSSSVNKKGHKVNKKFLYDNQNHVDTHKGKAYNKR